MAYIIQFILREELQRLKGQVINNMYAARKVVTGSFANSLAVSVRGDNYGTSAKLTAAPYFATVETGSAPWRRKYKTAPKFFAEIIGEWIDAKGLSLNPYAVATTIMRKGSKLYREGGRTDIYSDEIPKTVEEMQQRLTSLYRLEIVNSISRITNK